MKRKKIMILLLAFTMATNPYSVNVQAETSSNIIIRSTESLTPVIEPYTLTLNKSKATVKVGKNITLTPSFLETPTLVPDTSKVQKKSLNTDTTISLSTPNKITDILLDVSYKWTTSNKKVAKVNQSGVVTGKKKGTATISCTATITDSTGKTTTITSKCKVTVKK